MKTPSFTLSIAHQQQLIHSLFEAGLPLLPNNPATKHPDVRNWQRTDFTFEHIAANLEQRGGLGLRTGNSIEAIDLDSKHWLGEPGALIELFEQLISDHHPKLLEQLVIQTTPSGGRHYLYCCPGAVEGSKKLAQRPPSAAELADNPRAGPVTLIETRGNNAQVQIAPTAGYAIIQGELTALPVITTQERQLLLRCARMLSQVEIRSTIDTRARTNTSTQRVPAGGIRPGDLYNQNGGADDALQLLEHDGWAVVRERGDVLYLRRPGKHDGVSATFGYIGRGILHVFSSNAHPFEPGRSYTPFAIRSLYQFAGDYKACAKRIAEEHELSNPKQDATPDSSADGTKPEAGQGPVSGRIRAVLSAAGYHFRLNDLDAWVEVNGERLTDELEAEIIMTARDADVRPIEAVRELMLIEAKRNRYHPVKDYFNQLAWDGENHILHLCEHLTSSDPPIQYPSGDASLHSIYIYRWLIGAVAKIFEQAQNLTLVLAGPQGLGKSTLVRWLCSGLGDQYFLEMPIDPHDKDSDLRQMRTFIWEIAEIDATTRKADMSALKAFVTRQTATVRKAYARHDTVRPTITSFIGTLNKGEGFLSDSTGNRRFMVTTITAIDHRYRETVDVNQIWAQAVALYRQGQSWRLQPNEAQAQSDANAEHEFDTPLAGWLTTYFDLHAGPNEGLTSSEIIDHLRNHYDIRLSGNERSQAMAISSVLTPLGIERRRLGRGQPYVYIGVRPVTPS